MSSVACVDGTELNVPCNNNNRAIATSLRRRYYRALKHSKSLHRGGDPSDDIALWDGDDEENEEYHLNSMETFEYSRDQCLLEGGC